MKSKKYRRWEPPKTDPTGTFRGDGLMLLTFNTISTIHAYALRVNDRIKRLRSKQ